MLQGLWYKWTLLRILPLKWIALVSHFTGHTIRLPFALHVYGNMEGHIQLWLFLTNYSMATMLRMSSSKNILQHLDSTVHQFQKLSSFHMVSQVNLIWAYCCLALHSLEVMVCMTSLPPIIVDSIGGTMKILVSREVMSGKAEVITSSGFA